MFRSVCFFLVYLVSFQLYAAERTLLVLADSLSASYGIAIEDGWVSLLQQKLQATGHVFRVENASISGDTTYAARSRLEDILSHSQPVVTIVELGGNDGLRGLPIAEIRKNLDEIIALLLKKGSRVLLVPMLLPTNYGKVYIDQFSQIYTDLEKKYGVTLGKFIMDGVATRPELMQADGIHPTAEAQPLLLDNIWIDLEVMLKKISP